ncbi:uncharacterized protein [Cicer arietinum]|uniref:Uncharacterized protein LOC101492129 n=1 Tax=Cicer arietinum TaxID=3827 RepID=A0A1S2YQR5_CICAR|nr:uncharacterized protein LOC101492129 [Cicer arietinum]
MEEDEYPYPYPWNQHFFDNKNINIPNAQLIQVLEALKQASQNIQTNPDSPSIKPLFQLHTILSTDSNLSQHLNKLKTVIDSLHNSKPTLRSFLTRPLSTHSISKLASSIQSELQSWIDRETIQTLSNTLSNNYNHQHEFISLLTRFTHRVSQGFNRELQQLVLKFKLFSSLESILFDAKCSHLVREHAGFAIAALIRFNKDVFVGEVLMSPTVQALVSMASVGSIEVLCSLIRSIRSPIVDEIESNGEIPNIIVLLTSKDVKLSVLAMECVLEIGYFGRKEAVEGMLKEGVVEKLVELQRLEVSELKKEEEQEKCVNGGKMSPFGNCVAKFAVQLEVGEGLRQREKRAFKAEILVRVREACVSDAESATIVAEVLWGTSP